MKSSRDRVKALIRKKKNSRKKYREALVKEIGPESIVKEFIREFDDMRCEVKSPEAFHMYLDSMIESLQSKMNIIDPFSRVKIVWADMKDEEDTWDKLVISGIHIKWSDRYRQENNVTDEELYIDTGDLLMDSIFGE